MGNQYQKSILMDLRIKSKSENVKKYSELIFREFQKNSLIKEKTDTVLYIQSLLCNFFLAKLSSML